MSSLSIAARYKDFTVENVIYAAPVFTIPYVDSRLSRRPPFAAGEFQHNAWFVANLFLKDRPKPRFTKDFPLAWDNVFYDSPSLGYVTATHQKEIDYGPTILTYYYPMCGEQNGRQESVQLRLAAYRRCVPVGLPARSR